MSSTWRALARTRCLSAPPYRPPPIPRPPFDRWSVSSERAVPVEIKYCGLTRREDVEMAVELGASFVGVIFAGGPRLVSADRAAILFDGLPTTVRRVGVFGDPAAEEIATVARQASLDVVQLHGAWAPDRARALRANFRGEVWPVVRVDRDCQSADI